MANANMSPSDVRSTVNALECSPSKTSKQSPIRDGGSKASASMSTGSRFRPKAGQTKK